jgi:hypothetical protein
MRDMQGDDGQSYWSAGPGAIAPRPHADHGANLAWQEMDRSRRGCGTMFNAVTSPISKDEAPATEPIRERRTSARRSPGLGTVTVDSQVFWHPFLAKADRVLLICVKYVDRGASLTEDSAVDAAIDQLIARIKSLEDELEAEFAIRRTKLNFRLEGGRALFEQEILRAHRELRTGLVRYLLHARILHVLTAPVIYSLIVPLLLLDLCVTAYQAVCFPVYGIAKVRRGDYLIFDRSQLAYLNLLEKTNCAYCSYANGLLAYAREIAGRTEIYWCPIKHARRVIAAHEGYAAFADYGDAEAFRKQHEVNAS